jgi:hypothetical protein
VCSKVSHGKEFYILVCSKVSHGKKFYILVHSIQKR